MIDEPVPTCDVCGRAQGNSPNVLRDDQPADWNGETGNHLTCELHPTVVHAAEDLADLFVEPIELSPLYVHTVKIGNLSYSWEDYAPGINVKTDLAVALTYDAVVFEIQNAFIHEPGVVNVQFTTFTTNRYKDASRPSAITAKITCAKKEE